MAVDYDAPRHGPVDIEEESLEELKGRRIDASSAIDVDDEAAEAFELPGADLSDEELTVTVIPIQSDEFRCSSCFLIRHHRQLASRRHGQPICRECAG